MNRSRFGQFGLVVCLVIMSMFSATPARAAGSRYVSPSGTDTANDCTNIVSPCKTITRALTQATAGDTINVAAGTYSTTNGETLPLVPTVDVTLIGSILSPTYIDGGNTARVLTVNSGRSITLRYLTIRNANNTTLACSNGIGGGGICNLGTLNVFNSAFLNNSTSGNGGGIYNSGLADFSNNTFSGNSANKGGAIYNGETISANIGLFNNTISGNNATTSGGGIYQYIPSLLYLYNSIIANSTGGDYGYERNCTFCPSSGGSSNDLVQDGTYYTEISGDPMLYPLGNNGGPTQTMALKPNSPAIDAGDATTCSEPSRVNSLDQRGQPRNDLACDIGAYEMQMSDRNNTALTPSTSAMTTYGPPRVGIRDTSLLLHPGVITATKVTSWTGGTPSGTLGVWWELNAPTNTGLHFDIQLCYSDAEKGNFLENGSSHFWRYSGGIWYDVGSVMSYSGTSPNRCAVFNGADKLSRWTLATNNPGNTPTAVTVSSFKANSPTFDLAQWFAEILRHWLR